MAGVEKPPLIMIDTERELVAFSLQANNSFTCTYLTEGLGRFDQARKINARDFSDNTTTAS